MNKLSKNESGFSVVELLLVLIFLAVIGGVGYMVYRNNHKSTNANGSATNSALTDNGGKGGVAGPDTGPAKTEVFIIPEWKLTAEIPTPPEDAGLIQYKIATASGQTYAGFTTQELIDSDKADCTADNAPAGIVYKALPTDQYQGGGDATANQTVEQALKNGAASPYKEVNGYDYWYIHPQGICSTASNGPQLQADAVKQVEAIVTNLAQE